MTYNPYIWLIYITHAPYKLNHGSLPIAITTTTRQPNKKNALKTAPKKRVSKKTAPKTPPCLWCNQTMHWIWYGALGIGPPWATWKKWTNKNPPKWWWIISDGIPMVNRIRKKISLKSNKQIQDHEGFEIHHFLAPSRSSWYQQRKPKPANEMVFPSFLSSSQGTRFFL